MNHISYHHTACVVSISGGIDSAVTFALAVVSNVQPIPSSHHVVVIH